MRICSSIRGRLQIILFIAVVPIFIIVLLLDIKERSKMEKQAKEDIEHLSLLAKKNIDNFLTNSRFFLIAISHMQSFAEENNQNISTLFKHLLEHYPDYLNIGMANAKGDIVASALPFPGKINFSDLSWFKNSVRTKDFSLGNYQTGRITSVPVIVMSIPYFDKNGDLSNVIYLSLSLNSLENIIGDISLPSGYEFIITDNNNTVLSMHPHKKEMIGKTLSDTFSIKDRFLSNKNNPFYIDSLDGIPYIYSFKSAGYKEDNLYFAIGISKDKVLDEINKYIITHLFLFATVISTSLLCSWIFIRRFILSPLDKLTTGIKRIEERDFNVAIDIDKSSYEFKTLGRGLEMMAGSINNYIKESSQTDIKIRDNERRIKSILEAAPAVIIVLSPKGDILEFNKEAEKIYHVKQSEVLGKSYYELFLGDEEKSMVMDIIARVLEGNPVNNFETPIPPKTGEKLIFSWNLDRLTDSSGKVSGVIKAGIDITEMKKAEKILQEEYAKVEKTVNERTEDLQETQKAIMSIVSDLNTKTLELEKANEKLKELDRLKSTFIASMSHELRTPLNSIIGFSSILLNEWVGRLNQEQRDNLAIITKAGKHLLALINDIIDVSKIESGKIEPLIEDFDIYDLLHESVAYFEKEARDKGVELRYEAVHKNMHTDRRRLLQSVFNLLSNGIRATEKGEILITAKERGADNIEISVSDTGIGIMKEDFPKIFQSFSHIDENRSRRLDGTGLGLYLTKKLVSEILNGEITFKSIYQEGSIFTIYIPVSIPSTDDKGQGGNIKNRMSNIEQVMSNVEG